MVCAMAKDRISFEIDWLENDGKWILRCKHNGLCVLAPREDSVLNCLKTADEYYKEHMDGAKGKVQITVNYR